MTLARPETAPLNVVHSDTGEAHVLLPVDLADRLMTLLARTSADNPADAALVDSLYRAVSSAITPSDGCPGLWPDAAPYALTEPAVLGSTDTDFLAVLIPGSPTAWDAIDLAVEVARESGSDVTAGDPTWVAEVWAPHWMVLNTCESHGHDFHPELAAHGPRSTGAILVTRVDLSRA